MEAMGVMHLSSIWLDMNDNKQAGKVIKRALPTYALLRSVFKVFPSQR